MKHILKWFLMLTKRLYKKVSFVIILALIPLFVFTFSVAAEGEKGFLHVILVQTNPNDEISSQLISELTSEPSVVMFSTGNSAQKATEAVKRGDAHEAWIFPENMEKEIDKHIKIDSDKFISIVAREKSVFSMLSREKLTSAVYKYTAQAFYLDFTRTQVEGLDHLSDEELMYYYDNVSIDKELFTFGSSSAATTDANSSSNYLTSPIRGFLGILILLCGMASALYLMQDERNGTFAWAPDKIKLPIGFGSMFIAVLNVSVAALISILVSGLTVGLGKELLVSFMYCISCTAFCMILKMILCSIKLYAALIPLITVISMTVCPVFFNLNHVAQYILPPTYYVNAIYSDKYILYMAVYTAVCVLLCLMVHLLKNFRNKLFR